ncbi:hypothetical protein VNO80_02309 [Phaseolus coccineus]|uniref:EF-hand domain-containing protein n=1 Tax=Phaseolus coccineus TaxID=3886 RepID=A0AAN9NPG4_PHACN
MPVIIPRNQPLRIIPASGINGKQLPENVMMQKIMEKLKEADRDKDGCFNKNELKHALKDLGAFFPGWRADRAFGKVDINNDGQISGEEIDSLLEYLRSCGFGK